MYRIFILASLVITSIVLPVRANVYVHDDTINRTVRILESVSAQFGSPLEHNGTWGHLLMANPIDVCSSVEKVSQNGTLWIALIRRNKCTTFAQKVLYVQEAGYKAAIVYNVGSDELIPMQGDGHVEEEIKIPSVFVGEASGISLSRFYCCNPNFTIILRENHSGNDNNLIYLLPFAIVLPLCTIIMCFFMIVRCVMDQIKKRRLRLSKTNLKKLPIKKFKKGDDYEVCAICLDEFEDGDKLRILPCAHAYHLKCIDPWLTKNKQTCPLCNKKVFPRDDDSDAENGNRDELTNENEQTPLLASRNGTSTNYGILSVQARNERPGLSFDSEEEEEEEEDERDGAAAASDLRKGGRRDVTVHLESSVQVHHPTSINSSSSSSILDEEMTIKGKRQTEADRARDWEGEKIGKQAKEEEGARGRRQSKNEEEEKKKQINQGFTSDVDEDDDDYGQRMKSKEGSRKSHQHNKEDDDDDAEVKVLIGRSCQRHKYK